jgi:hypothetical protein
MKMPKSLVPHQKFDKKEKIAEIILYLAYRAGEYCNGIAFLVNSGVISIHLISYCCSEIR